MGVSGSAVLSSVAGWVAEEDELQQLLLLALSWTSPCIRCHNLIPKNLYALSSRAEEAGAQCSFMTCQAVYVGSSMCKNQHINITNTHPRTTPPAFNSSDQTPSSSGSASYRTHTNDKFDILAARHVISPPSSIVLQVCLPSSSVPRRSLDALLLRLPSSAPYTNSRASLTGSQALMRWQAVVTGRPYLAHTRA